MSEMTFKVDDVEYKVVEPTGEQVRASEIAKDAAYNDALLAKCPFQSQMKDILTERGMWSDKQEKEYEVLRTRIIEKEYVLAAGGIKKSSAKTVALELKALRRELEELFTPITNFRSKTCEGKAENAKFNYLVSVCVVYSNDGRPYFNSYEDYLRKSNDAVAILGSAKFAEMYYNLTEDFTADLPENQFLKEFGFVDEQYRLVDSEGRLISEDGRLINEEGNLVDEDGDIVDILGHKLDKDGKFKVERQPFLDDEADSVQDSAKPKKKK